MNLDNLDALGFGAISAAIAYCLKKAVDAWATIADRRDRREGVKESKDAATVRGMFNELQNRLDRSEKRYDELKEACEKERGEAATRDESRIAENLSLWTELRRVQARLQLLEPS